MEAFDLGDSGSRRAQERMWTDQIFDAMIPFAETPDLAWLVLHARQYMLGEPVAPAVSWAAFHADRGTPDDEWTDDGFQAIAIALQWDVANNAPPIDAKAFYDIVSAGEMALLTHVRREEANRKREDAEMTMLARYMDHFTEKLMHHLTEALDTLGRQRRLMRAQQTMLLVYADMTNQLNDVIDDCEEESALAQATIRALREEMREEASSGNVTRGFFNRMLDVLRPLAMMPDRVGLAESAVRNEREEFIRNNIAALRARGVSDRGQIAQLLDILDVRLDREDAILFKPQDEVRLALDMVLQHQEALQEEDRTIVEELNVVEARVNAEYDREEFHAMLHEPVRSQYLWRPLRDRSERESFEVSEVDLEGDLAEVLQSLAQAPPVAALSHIVHHRLCSRVRAAQTDDTVHADKLIVTSKEAENAANRLRGLNAFAGNRVFALDAGTIAALVREDADQLIAGTVRDLTTNPLGAGTKEGTLVVERFTDPRKLLPGRRTKRLQFSVLLSAEQDARNDFAGKPSPDRGQITDNTQSKHRVVVITDRTSSLKVDTFFKGSKGTPVILNLEIRTNDGKEYVYKGLTMFDADSIKQVAAQLDRTGSGVFISQAFRTASDTIKGPRRFIALQFEGFTLRRIYLYAVQGLLGAS